MILRNNIKKLVISCTDPNPKIAGTSLKHLENNGVQITKGVLEEKGNELIKVFTKNILTKKPFVTLKYAQSKDFFISKSNQKVQLSNKYSNICCP
ncbi:MAG: hypothetical protein R2771_13865 [Saprospiraceae bacterium]